MNYNQGYLTIYIGGVRSGKSSMGVSKYIHYRELGRFNPVIIITDDAVRSDDPIFKIRDIPYLTTPKNATFEERILQLEEYDVIIIDECQFYPHLKRVVIHLLGLGKRIYLCGLDGTFQGLPIGETFDLIPLCDEIFKFRGECVTCIEEGRGIINPSIRSIRVDGRKDGPIIEIAGLETFKPVCREHDNL